MKEKQFNLKGFKDSSVKRPEVNTEWQIISAIATGAVPEKCLIRKLLIFNYLAFLRSKKIREKKCVVVVVVLETKNDCIYIFLWTSKMLSSIKMFKSQILNKTHYLTQFSLITLLAEFQVELLSRQNLPGFLIQGQPGYIVRLYFQKKKKIKSNQNENLWKEKGTQQDL